MTPRGDGRPIGKEPDQRQEQVDGLPAVENAEYVKFVRRILRALGRRVATSDPESLRELVRLRADLDAAIIASIAHLRADYSWSEIARSLGVTKQAAEQRYGRHTR